MAMDTQRLDGLQVLRALAAILVVFDHLGSLGQSQLGLNLQLPDYLGFDVAGVDLFFVLSGFIICYVTADVAKFDLKNFAWRRLARIYPFYLFFTLVVLGAWLYNSSWTFGMPQHTGEAILKSLVLFPQLQSPILYPGWTLEHEFIFYALAGLVLSFATHRWLVVLLAGLFLLGVGNRYFLAEPIWDFHLLSLFHFQFMGGVLVFLNRDRLAYLGRLIPSLLGVFLLAVTAYGMEHDWGPDLGNANFYGVLRVVGFGLAGVFFLVAALNFSASMRGGRLQRLGMALGDASYTLYLSHPIILAVLGKVAGYLGIGGWAGYLYLAACLAACCVASLLFFRWIEQPLVNYLKRF